MKKRSLFVFALIALIAFAFISCKNEAKPPQEHEHTFEKEWSSDDTYHYHKATCEHTSEVKDKAEHTFGEWITITEATKTEEGKRERECSVCKYKQEENIPTTTKRAIKVKRVLDKTYDGETIVLTKDDIEYKGDVATVTFEYGVKDSTGTYSPIGTYPRGAGDYEVKIIVGASGGIEEEYALEHFTIEKKTLNIGHSEFTSYFDGECQKVFSIPSGSGLIDGDNVLIRILKKNEWKKDDIYTLYLEGSEESETIEQVCLIGTNAQNYDLKVLDGGNLDATLYCRYKETKINASNVENYGVVNITPILYGDDVIDIKGDYEYDFAKKIASDTDFNQYSFKVFAGKTMIARAYRVITADADPTNKKYDYIDAELDDEQEEVHLFIDLLSNVEGYTDAAGKWICKEDELNVNVEVEAPVVGFIEASASDSGEKSKYFEGKHRAGEYLLMKFIMDDGESSQIEFKFDTDFAADVNVFEITETGLKKLDEDPTYHYYNISDECYIVVNVTADGSGGMKIIWG